MTNVMHKFLIYLSIYFCLTCFGFSFSPSSEAGVQIRQWFKFPGYGVSAQGPEIEPGVRRFPYQLLKSLIRVVLQQLSPFPTVPPVLIVPVTIWTFSPPSFALVTEWGPYIAKEGKLLMIMIFGSFSKCPVGIQAGTQNTMTVDFRNLFHILHANLGITLQKTETLIFYNWTHQVDVKTRHTLTRPQASNSGK
jgi:hypothetical protein